MESYRINMKSILIILSFVILTNCKYSDDEKVCKKVLTATCDSCSTTQVCDSVKNNSGIKAKCPPHAPHCYKDTEKDAFCSATNQKEFCAQINHRCTSVGIFPDPRDCHHYFYCTKSGISGSVPRRDCENGMVFNEASKGCRLSSTASDCVTVDCSKHLGNGLYSPYGSSKKYYALCYEKATPDSDGLPNDIVMYQCGTGAEFDSKSSSCIYKCTKTGNFPNSADPTTYFICTVVNGKYVSKLKECTEGEEFLNNTCMPVRLNKH